MSDDVNELVDMQEVTDDEFDCLNHLDLGDIDPDSYQESEDDGCEGGACKI